mmetsp:Transcript_44383/g.99913  ORF Transcript_44383/g.99913 Transcript_44383/m.99913 type:complete len:238 (-) Transcript_44383:454-1167(-)
MPSLSMSAHSLGSSGKRSSLSAIPSLSRSSLKRLPSMGNESCSFGTPSPSMSGSELSPMPSLSISAHSLASFGKRSFSFGMPSPSMSEFTLMMVTLVMFVLFRGSLPPGACSSFFSEASSSSCGFSFSGSFFFSSSFLSSSFGMILILFASLQYAFWARLPPSASLQCSWTPFLKRLQRPSPVDIFAHWRPRNFRHSLWFQRSGRIQQRRARMQLILFIRGFFTFSAIFFTITFATW